MKICAVKFGTKSVVPKWLEIGTRITCPEWMRLPWMAQLWSTCWSHITARWLSSMSTGLLNSETCLHDGHNKEELFRYLVECTAALRHDGKKIVSTSDDIVDSMNHKHLIIIRKWNQDSSFVCHALQDGYDRTMIHPTDTCCKAVDCYGYRNAIVLYPSILSVWQSRPGPKLGPSIFLYLHWMWNHLFI